MQHSFPANDPLQGSSDLHEMIAQRCYEKFDQTRGDDITGTQLVILGTGMNLEGVCLALMHAHQKGNHRSADPQTRNPEPTSFAPDSLEKDVQPSSDALRRRHQPLHLILLPDQCSTCVLRYLASALKSTQQCFSHRMLMGVLCCEEGTTPKDRARFYQRGGVVLTPSRTFCVDVLHRRLATELVQSVQCIFPCNMLAGRVDQSMPSMAFAVELLLRGGPRQLRPPVTVLSDNPCAIQYCVTRRQTPGGPLLRRLHVGDMQLFPRFRLDVIGHFDALEKRRLQQAGEGSGTAKLSVETIHVAFTVLTRALVELLSRILSEVLSELGRLEARLDPTSASKEPSRTSFGSWRAASTVHTETEFGTGIRHPIAAQILQRSSAPAVATGTTTAPTSLVLHDSFPCGVKFSTMSVEDVFSGDSNGLLPTLRFALLSNRPAVLPFKGLLESLLEVRALLRMALTLTPGMFLLQMEHILAQHSWRAMTQRQFLDKAAPRALWTLTEHFGSLCTVATNRVFVVSERNGKNGDSTAPGDNGGSISIAYASRRTPFPLTDKSDPALPIPPPVLVQKAVGVNSVPLADAAAEGRDSLVIDVDEDEELSEIPTRTRGHVQLRPNVQEQDILLTTVRQLVSSWCRAHGRQLLAQQAKAMSASGLGHMTEVVYDVDACDEVEDPTKTAVPPGGITGVLPAAPALMIVAFSDRTVQRIVSLLVLTAEDFHVLEFNNFLARYQGDYGQAPVPSSSKCTAKQRDQTNTAKPNPEAERVEGIPNQTETFKRSRVTPGSAAGGEQHPEPWSGPTASRERLDGAGWVQFLSQAETGASIEEGGDAMDSDSNRLFDDFLYPRSAAEDGNPEADQDERQWKRRWRQGRAGREKEATRAAKVGGCCDTPAQDGPEDLDILLSQAQHEKLLEMPPLPLTQASGAVKPTQSNYLVEPQQQQQLQSALPPLPAASTISEPHPNAFSSYHFEVTAMVDGTVFLQASFMPPTSTTSPERPEVGKLDIIVINGDRCHMGDLLQFTLCGFLQPHACVTPEENQAPKIPDRLCQPVRRWLLLEPNVRFLRLLECLEDSLAHRREAATAHCQGMKVQILQLPGEHAAVLGYGQVTLQNEKNAFQDLAQAKAKLTGELLCDRLALQQAEEELQSGIRKSHNVLLQSRRAAVRGARNVSGDLQSPTSNAHAGRPVLVFDEREFRSQLPYCLFCRSFDVVPMTLTYGDYFLGPQYVVERKSIPDFCQSLQSGRLANQLGALCRRYEHPICLIEFDRQKAFRLALMTPWRVATNIQRMSLLYRKVAKLVTAFSQVHFLWSRSPYHTAAMFAQIKDTFAKVPVDPGDPSLTETFMESDRREEVTCAVRILQRFPGVTPENVSKVMDRCGTLAGLAEVPEGELIAAIGHSNGSKLYRFLHDSLMEPVD